MRGLFLIGTDTGVGKTTLGCGLLRLAHRRRFALVPFKPVETGCDPVPHDADRLRTAAALPGLNTADVCALPLVAPIAPSVAARLENRHIDLEYLVRHAKGLARRGDALLVEGAGGLLTPFGSEASAATLASLLDVAVLIVAANRLGTINHTALTFAELQRRGLSCAGIVLVNTTPELGPDGEFNAEEIHAATGRKPLGTLRHCEDRTNPDVLADAVAGDLELGELLEGRLTFSAARPVTRGQ